MVLRPNLEDVGIMLFLCFKTWLNPHKPLGLTPCPTWDWNPLVLLGTLVWLMGTHAASDMYHCRSLLWILFTYIWTIWNSSGGQTGVNYNNRDCIVFTKKKLFVCHLQNLSHWHWEKKTQSAAYKLPPPVIDPSTCKQIILTGYKPSRPKRQLTVHCKQCFSEKNIIHIATFINS